MDEALVQERKLLADAAFEDGCHESTRDALLNDPPEMLGMHRVKASAAILALTRALQSSPADALEEVGRALLVEFFRGPGAQLGNHGDYEGWTPYQTAVHFLTEYVKRDPEWPLPQASTRTDALDERAAIVEWVRQAGKQQSAAEADYSLDSMGGEVAASEFAWELADAIERGDHITSNASEG